MFQYLLFDLDGTVLDTHEAIFQSFEYTLKTELGLKVSRDQLLKLFGQPLFKQMTYFSPDSADRLCQIYRQHYSINSTKLTKPYPGVIEVLKELNKSQIPVGIVTNKYHHPAIKAIKDTGLFPFINFLIGGDEVSQTKPHPEAIFKGIKLLDAEPTRTLMIGDSPLDIEAAQNAGIKSALVSWTIFAEDRFNQITPDYYLNQMTDLLYLIKDDVA